MRGLKRYVDFGSHNPDHVAPHAGAWIETSYNQPRRDIIIVAPHAGAWIETYHKGLYDGTIYVAPHAGAWIET